MDNDAKKNLIARLSTFSSVGDSLKALQELVNIRTSDPDLFSQGEFFQNGHKALKDIRAYTKEQGEFSRSAISFFALRFCLEPGESDFNRFRIREMLGEWINELPSEWQNQVIGDCYAELGKALNSDRDEIREASCWAIGAIGYRQIDIIEALEKLSQQDDELGDIALDTLVDLSGTNQAQPYCRKALNRIQHRWDSTLARTLMRSNEDRAISMIANLLQDAPWPTSATGQLQAILAKVAAVVDDREAKSRAVKSIISLQERLPGNGLLLRIDLLPIIDSESSTRYFLGRLAEDVNSDDVSHAHRLAICRVMDCVFENQVEACVNGLEPKGEEKVLEYLCKNDGYDGSAITHLSDLKTQSIRVLLRCGSLSLLNCYHKILLSETVDYKKRELLEALSVFTFENFPESVEDMIKCEEDLKKGQESRLVMRLAASIFVGNSASQRGLELLLDSGLTFNGSVMADTVDALANITLDLCREETARSKILDQLLEKLNDNPRPPQRSSICRAINHLAIHNRLPKSFLEKIEYVLENFSDDSNGFFSKSLLVEALGAFSFKEIPVKLIECILVWSQQNNWLGWRSLECLILSGTFIKVADAIAPLLGLEKASLGWEMTNLSPACQWAPLLVVLLYEQEPNDFKSAVCQAIESDNWEISHRTIKALAKTYARTGKFAEENIARALVRQAIRCNTPTRTDGMLFGYCSRHATRAFLDTSWFGYWNDWRSESRMAFCDALGDLAECPHELWLPFFKDWEDWLSIAIEDAAYGVRRSAMRAWKRLANHHFERKIRELTKSERIERRKIASEGLAWVGEDECLDLQSALESDPSLPVRVGVQSSQKLRNLRSLAERYFDRLKDLEDPTNQKLLSYIKYAQALEKVGDDETLRRIPQHLQSHRLPSRLITFFKQLHENLEKEWNKKVKEWPEPAKIIKDKLRSGHGFLTINGMDISVSYDIWYQVDPEIGSQIRWGGTALLEQTGHLDNIMRQEILFKTEDGESLVSIYSIHQGSNQKTSVEFSGNDALPFRSQN